MPLLRRVIRAVEPLMVLASGGIATGADVAEALAHGAEGVWVGTRMVASTEAFAHPEYKRRLLAAHGRATAVTTAFGPEYPNVPYRVLRTDLVKRIAGREHEIPPSQPGDPPIGETVLFPFTLRVPYTMPPFSAVVPTPDTNGQFALMGLPAGEDSVRKIEAVKPAAEIVAEMMAEARASLEAKLTLRGGVISTRCRSVGGSPYFVRSDSAQSGHASPTCKVLCDFPRLSGLDRVLLPPIELFTPSTTAFSGTATARQ